MDPVKLSIIIVTANRYAQLETCIDRLLMLPWIDRVKVKIYDNTPIKDAFDLTKTWKLPSNFSYEWYQTFIECRNKSIEQCDTEFFMILDDDDYLSVDSIPTILHYIHEYPSADFFSYGVEKEGRISHWNSHVYTIDNLRQKFNSLNRFYCYDVDRLIMVYLWNCANVIRTKLFEGNLPWRYPGCDDILPITDFYLRSSLAVRINRCIYYYPRQTTVCKVKTNEDLHDLERRMYKSYECLLDKYKNSDDGYTAIIQKALYNSICQMTIIDNWVPNSLHKLYTGYDYINTKTNIPGRGTGECIPPR